jgi:acyl-CoA synthetase (AMP-forming)/AMP-acid ligase II
MGAAYFVIAILGCADGGTACTQVATLETRYSSEVECTAATAAALIENSEFDFPTLVASCRRREMKSADLRRQGDGKRRTG